MRVKNLIAFCDDGRERLIDVNQRRIVVVHRCGMGEDAVSVASAFQAPGQAGSATGHQMPYTFVVTRQGDVQQALRIGDVGPHALAWNVPGIGVALVGDMREEPATTEQRASLIELCRVLCGWLGKDECIWGHDELKGGSKDLSKECPGRYLDMGALRRDVEAATCYTCESAGIVF